jgi:hypothetical protein
MHNHDYGVLVTSLHNEKLINFDRVVSDISFPMSQSPLTRPRPEVKNETDGSVTEGAYPDVTPDREPAPPLTGGHITARQILDCVSDDPILVQAKLMVMKARDRL